MATSIAVYANGSAGVMTGSAISLDGVETARFPLPALNTAYTMMYRTVDSSGNDPLEDTDSSFTVTVPAGFEVSATASAGAWATTAVLPTAVGSNKPLYIRQTVGVVDGDYDIEVGTGGVTFTTGTRLAAITGLTASGLSGSVHVTWTANASADGYTLQYGLASASFTTTASATTNSATVSSLTNGSAYIFRVRGYDEFGNSSAWSATASATPVSVFWSDDFEDNSIDTAKWLLASDNTAGKVSETGGQLVVDTTGVNSDVAVVSSQNLVRNDTAGKLTVNGDVHAGTATTQGLLALYSDKMETVADLDFTNEACVQINATIASDYTSISYWNTSNVRTYYTGSGWSTSNTNISGTWNENDTYRVITHIDYANNDIWWEVLRNGSAQLDTASYKVDLNSVRSATGGWYLVVADTSASTSQKNHVSDVTYEAL